MHWSAEPSVWIFMSFNYYNAHAHFLQKNGRPYGHSTEAVLDLRNGAVSEKTPQIFRLPLPAEYMTEYSGRTNAPEMGFHLTDTRMTTVTLAAHARRGLIKHVAHRSKILAKNGWPASMCLQALHLGFEKILAWDLGNILHNPNSNILAWSVSLSTFLKYFFSCSSWGFSGTYVCIPVWHCSSQWYILLLGSGGQENNRRGRESPALPGPQYWVQNHQSECGGHLSVFSYM